MKGKNGSRRHKVQGRKMVIWNWLVMVKLEKTIVLGIGLGMRIYKTGWWVSWEEWA